MSNTRSPKSRGEYRLRDTVSVDEEVLVSSQPLVATRLNDAAVDLIETLDSGRFRSPEAVAAGTAHDTRSVVRLFERLRQRGFLDWRPARDPEFEPPVSIVVTARNDREHLGRCLDALVELAYPAYEVVVVDDGSTDGTGEMIANHEIAAVGRVRVVSVGDPNDPLGIGASRNRGIEAAAHDVIAFTDADCRPRTNWLADLVPYLAANDIVGGRIRPAGDTTASTYEGINSSLDMGAYASRIDPGGDTPYLATANLVGRRAVFETVPFPDRDVAEDVDVCWRAVEVGFEIVYVPSGVVEHAYRDGIREFAARRATYGDSEALLARDYGRDDSGSIGVPTVLVLVVVAGLLGSISSGAVSTGVLGSAGSLVALVGSVRGWRLWRRHRRLTPTVSATDMANSWRRKRLSSAYAASREITRYYAAPIALLGGLVWLAGARGLAVCLLGTVTAALVLPLVVEYRVHDPDASLAGYGAYYFADHLGYEHGIYRGAFARRTLAHINPRTRFRLVGPGASFLARVRPERDAGSTRIVTVGSATAQFRVDSTAEQWWFHDDTLRGERGVVADLLERLDPDDVFFDVGANVGLYSCLVGRALDGGAVVSFEPHPENAARLVENLSTNGVDARVIRQALGAENRRGTLASRERVPGSGTAALVEAGQRPNDGRSGTDRAPVTRPGDESRRTGSDETLPSTPRLHSTPVTTGDALVASGDVSQPTVLKIDVEGAETAVLRGLRSTLSDSACRLVYCELHPESLADRGSSVAEVRAVLRESGFVVEPIQDLPDERTVVRARKAREEHGRNRAWDG